MTIRKEEILSCLAEHPDGCTIDVVWAWLDNVGTRDAVAAHMGRLIGRGLVVSSPANTDDALIRGANARRRYRLVKK